MQQLLTVRLAGLHRASQDVPNGTNRLYTGISSSTCRIVRSGRIREALRRSVATLVLQSDAGYGPGQAFTDQPGDPDSRLVIAQPSAMDVRDAIALGIGQANSRPKGQIGPETVGGGKPRPFADQHHDHSCRENGADVIAQGNSRTRRNDHMADTDLVG